MSRLALTAAALLLLGATTTVPSAGAAADPDPVGLRAQFPSSSGGFTTEGEPATWSATGGDPDAFVSGQRRIEASQRWHGDRRAAYGGRLTFSVRVPATESGTAPVGVVLGAGRLVLSAEAVVPAGEWAEVTLPLTTGSGWTYEDGTPGVLDDPTPAEFRSVLAGLGALGVLADGPLDLDSLVMAGRVARSSTIRRSGDRLSGVLSSPVRLCASDVSVQVVRLTARGATPVGRDRTSRNGAWSLARDLPQGRYRARIAPRFLPGAGDCSLALSRAVAIG